MIRNSNTVLYRISLRRHRGGARCAAWARWHPAPAPFVRQGSSLMTVRVYMYKRTVACSSLLSLLSVGLTAAWPRLQTPSLKSDDAPAVPCFDPLDATACLQSALTGAAPVVTIPARGGQPWITRPLRINGSNREIILEPGCVIQAKRGEFRGPQDSLFLIAGATNITLRGRNQFPHPGRERFGTDSINLTAIPLLRMWKTDYANASKYSTAEWRMGIWIGEGTASCGPTAPRDRFPYGPCSPTSGIVISDIRVESSGGDGIYVQNASNVSVLRVDSNDHYRQGLSVIDASGLRIANSSFRNTNGTAPSCGIDLEPSDPGQLMAGVAISNCLLANNTGCGLAISLGFVIGSNAPVSVDVSNITMTNNTQAIAAGNLVDVNGSVAIADVLINQDSCPQPERPAIQLTNKGTDGPALMFDRIQLNSCTRATTAPVLFDVRANPSGSDVLRSPFGGIDLHEIAIRQSASIAGLSFLNVSMQVPSGCWPTNSTHCWQPRCILRNKFSLPANLWLSEQRCHISTWYSLFYGKIIVLRSRYVDIANVTGSFHILSASAKSCDLVHRWKATPPGWNVTCVTQQR